MSFRHPAYQESRFKTALLRRRGTYRQRLLASLVVRRGGIAEAETSLKEQVQRLTVAASGISETRVPGAGQASPDLVSR